MLTTYQTPQQTNAGAKKKTKKETDEAVYKKVEDEVYQKVCVNFTSLDASNPLRLKKILTYK